MSEAIPVWYLRVTVTHNSQVIDVSDLQWDFEPDITVQDVCDRMCISHWARAEWQYAGDVPATHVLQPSATNCAEAPNYLVIQSLSRATPRALLPLLGLCSAMPPVAPLSPVPLPPLPLPLPPPHDEHQYLALVRDVLSSGLVRGAERTGVGTLAKFGAQCRYQLVRPQTGSPVLPLFTTKRVSFRNVWSELLFFLHGQSHVVALHLRQCHIWDPNSTREYLDAVGLPHYPVGQLGPIYGCQWRHFGGRYLGASAETGDSLYAPNQPGIDQLQQVIAGLRAQPESRRHLVVAWNPTDLPHMALPPCHVMFQFFAETDAHGQKWLSCQMYQRSADLGLGVPYNVASYALLTHLVAHLTGMKAKEFIHVLGDYHVYRSHVDALTLQCQREPRPFPILTIRPEWRELKDLTFQDVMLGPYDPCPPLALPMAV